MSKEVLLIILFVLFMFFGLPYIVYKFKHDNKTETQLFKDYLTGKVFKEFYLDK